MNRQRKIYVALLMTALAALAVDRLLLEAGASGPTEAEATPAVVETRVIDENLDRINRVIAHADAAVAEMGGEHGLAMQLSRVAEERRLAKQALANPFAVPAHWQPAEARATPGESSTPQTIDPAEEFRNEHQLQAVMQQREGGGIAIINGRPIGIGEGVGSFVLTRLRGREATLERGEVSVTLTIKRAGEDEDDGVRSKTQAQAGDQR
ncbi:MAG: hypothetical protein WD294_02675 [Phycisphaeraceae bacterium]